MPFDSESLIVLAALVIAFVNWLFNQLKEAAARKERERRIANGEEVEDDEPDFEVVYVDQPEAGPAESAGSAGTGTGLDALRHYFESLAVPPGAQAAEAERARQQGAGARQPQPSPSHPQQQRAATGRPQAPPPPALSAEERRALQRISKARSSWEVKPDAKKPHPLIAKLREPGGAKQAIILAEILGRPKALSDR